MLDLSPEKLIVLLAVGLVVLGPNKLPGAARGLAHGLARARRLASALTDPISTSFAEPVRAHLAEPRRAVDDAVAVLRSTITNHPLPGPAEPDGSPSDPRLN